MAEMTIRRFGILSVAKIYGLLTFIMGLIIGVIYGLFFMIFGAAMSAMTPNRDGAAFGGASSVVMGLIFMLVVPVVYGFFGFVAGAIGSAIYNLAAGVIGGVKFELESASPEYTAPPPPNQWDASPYPAQ
jgi:hypothetical protein